MGAISLSFVFKFLILLHPDSLDCRYAQAMSYVNQFQNIQSQIKKDFGKEITAIDTPIISNEIVDIDYSPFCNKNLKNDDCCPFIKTDTSLSEKSHFSPYKVDFIPDRYVNRNSKLIMYFSRPVGNYLTAWIVRRRSNHMDFNVNFGYGTAMKLVFIFDESNVLTKVCRTSVSLD
jgi:hypothetical protein